MSNRLLVPKHRRFLLETVAIIPGIMPLPVFLTAPPPPAVGTAVLIVDTAGAGTFTVPSYQTLTIEVWGAGASAGINNIGGAGGVNGANSTVSTYGITAGGGLRSAAASVSGPNIAYVGGLGGTASGGNTTNTNGGAAVTPASSAGPIGDGGNSPNGGLGGVGPAKNPNNPGTPGNDGQIPGGGGSGYTIQNYMYPSGGAGAYVKHVLVAGAGGSPNVGDVINYNVAAQTAANTNFGRGAQGRVKFTWTFDASPGVIIFDEMAGAQITIPSWSTLTIEAWAGGGGAPGVHQSGGTIPSVASTGSSVAATGMTTMTCPAPVNLGTAGGLVATGGNDTNTAGGAGSNAPSSTQGGKGGDAPNGGAGGAQPANAGGGQAIHGNAGGHPAGGGSGGSFNISGVSSARAGAGSGSYSKSVFTAGSGPAQGATFTITAGKRGRGGVTTANGGDGGVGRVKFTVA